MNSNTPNVTLICGSGHDKHIYFIYPELFCVVIEFFFEFVIDLSRAEINIRPWRSMLKAIKEGNAKTRWEDRVPYAYWKGNPHVCPWRGELMQCNATDQNDWNARLYVQVCISATISHLIIG